MKYGWPASRILDGYTQHVNAVKGERPRGYKSTSTQAPDANEQCFELCASLQHYDERLMRKALGRCSLLSVDERNRYLDFIMALTCYLVDHPWEPVDREEKNPPVHENMDSLNLIHEATGIPVRTLRYWAEHGMPHRRVKGKIYAQPSVVERWNKLKTPKRKTVV